MQILRYLWKLLMQLAQKLKDLIAAETKQAADRELLVTELQAKLAAALASIEALSEEAAKVPALASSVASLTAEIDEALGLADSIAAIVPDPVAVVEAVEVVAAVEAVEKAAE